MDGVEIEAKRIGDWCTTYTGVQFYHLDPQSGDLNIVDIVVGLSNECRWGGQLPNHYSVAQHSVICSYADLGLFDSPLLRLFLLLHDAAEAYYKDIPRPAKRLMSRYKKMEHRCQMLIFAWMGMLMQANTERAGFFDIDVGKGWEKSILAQIIKHVDNAVLNTERRDVVSTNCKWEARLPPPLRNRNVATSFDGNVREVVVVPCRPCSPIAARRWFWIRLVELVTECRAAGYLINFDATIPPGCS